MKKTTATTIAKYNALQKKPIREICTVLQTEIQKNLKKSESKIWHGSPVWFIDENPVVAYSTRVSGKVSLMFFSGQSFDEVGLQNEGKFKAAEILYGDVSEIKTPHLRRWLKKSVKIQWDYKNLVKNKGTLVKVPARTEKVCSRGHVFTKSKDVPTCPTCWPGRYKLKK